MPQEKGISYSDPASDKEEDQNLYLSAAIRVMHEALHSGMWSMDFNGEGRMTAVHWSDEFRRMLGYRDLSDFPDTLEAWTEKLHPDDLAWVLREFNETISDYSNRKSYDVEYRLRVRDGQWRWFHAMGRLIRRPDGSPRTYVGMFVDITASREKEQQLRDALHAAEEASRAKTTFLSHMSHDIRTPINGIMGMTGIALRHLDDPVRLRDCLGKIDDSSHHLLMLINDVLDMSRIESGRLEVNHAPFDLAALVADCSSIIQGQLVGRKVSYSADCSSVIHRRLIGDELHLRQILINILGNSVKFTSDGDSISFIVRELSCEDGKALLRFELADTGIGISEEFLPRLFDSFSQEDGGSRTHYKGTGLGMAITKQLVELLGGSIAVESRLNAGTKFTVDLPMDIDADAAAPHLPEEGPAGAVDLTGMHILVAEDNEINMEIVTVLLGELGASITQAFNGRLAVEAFAASEPGSFDAILMDVMMPEMDGFEATRVIRAMDRPDAAEIPIIAATANAYEEDVEKTRAAGMNAHISKPLDINALARLLQRFHSRHGH